MQFVTSKTQATSDAIDKSANKQHITVACGPKLDIGETYA